MNSNVNIESGTPARLLGRHWWVLALRGLAAVIFGILAFAWPGGTLLALVILFGSYSLVNGILSLVLATQTSHGSQFLHFVLPGLLGIAAGLVTFCLPGVTALVLLVIIAVWAIANGILEIVTAIRLRKEIANEWLLVLAGVTSTIFGGLLLFWPKLGILALLWWMGSFAIVFGLLLIALAFRVKKWEALAVR